MNEPIYIKGAAACCPEPWRLENYGLNLFDVDKNLIPASLRRRTSLTTRIAITAAHAACQQASADASKLPSIFASLGGEIQVTDALCLLLPSPETLSPTQFHNSVHNTTAGYWGILNQCQAPATAIAALDDTFAMAIIEAWAQLQMRQGDLLLVCYDEIWPSYLAPPIGQYGFGCALVLSTDKLNAIASISLPRIENHPADENAGWQTLCNLAPAAVAIPLLNAIYEHSNKIRIPLNTKGDIWFTNCEASH